MATIDIIIPAYNVGAFIAETIHSVLQQTLMPSRIIIVDDASTDNTVEEIRKINHPLVELICHETNQGVSKTRNDGIAVSTGEYIAFLDGDDIWHPQKLEKQIHAFQTTDIDNVGCVYVAHDFLIQDNAPLTHRPKAPKYRGAIHNDLMHGNCITGSSSSIMFSRASLAQTGFFDENLIFGEDWDFWLRASLYFNFDFVPEKLVSIRLHPNSSQRRYFASKQKRIINDQLALLGKANAPLSAYAHCYRHILYSQFMDNTLPLWQRLSLWHAIQSYPSPEPIPLYLVIKTYILTLLKILKDFVK